MERYNKQVKILKKYFSIYGYGNFDLTDVEKAELLMALNSKNPEERVKEIYERLSKIRLG